jgi:Ca2+-transporting ATPase
MQAFINFLISCNIGEVLAVFFASVFGFPSLLSSLQLLWVNLVTDGPPATALGYNPPDSEVMSRSPRDRNEEIITPWLLTRYFITGTYIAISTVGIFASYFLDSGLSFEQVRQWSTCAEWASNNSICLAFSQESLSTPQTLALSTLVTVELLKALSSVSVDTSITKIGPQRNPALILGVLSPFLIHLGIIYSGNLGVPSIASSFGVVPLSAEQWISVFLWSLPILLIDDILKAYGNTITKNSQKANR